MRKEFAVHRLGAEGLARAQRVAEAFDALLAAVEREAEIAPESRGDGARELALVRTHLEIAGFYAKKACAVQKKNQEAP